MARCSWSLEILLLRGKHFGERFFIPQYLFSTCSEDRRISPCPALKKTQPFIEYQPKVPTYFSKGRMGFLQATFGFLLQTAWNYYFKLCVCTCVHAHTFLRADRQRLEKDKATVTINESVTGGDSNFQNWTQKQMLILGSTLFHCSLFAEEHLLESWAFFSGFCSPYLYVFSGTKIFKTHLKNVFQDATSPWLVCSWQTQRSSLFY